MKRDREKEYEEYRGLCDAIIGKVQPICDKHGSVMTFGRYSKHSIFQDAHKEVGTHIYYCNECVDELLPEYKRYRKAYK